MKIRYGLALALALGLSVAGCASGGGGSGAAVGGSGGALVSGENPRNSDNTRAAERHLEAGDDATDAAEAQMHYEQAMVSAEAAIAEDPRNPLAHRLAAMASMGLDDYESARAHFDHAVELRPLYEFDVTPIREQAWIDLYQEATPYIQGGEYERAAVYFERANAIYDERPEGFITVGQIYASLRQHDEAIANLDAAIDFVNGEMMAEVDSATAAGWREQVEPLPLLRAQVLADGGRFEEAAAAYRALAVEHPEDVDLKSQLATILLQMGSQEEAFVVYDGLLGTPGLSGTQYFSVGVGFYQGEDYTRAAQAFRAAATASPNDRDALEFWARSLQIDSAYADIPPVAARWTALDPNNPNAHLILAQAANQLGDQDLTRQAITAVDQLEVQMMDLQLQRYSDGGAVISGSVVNKKMDEGTTVTIRFTFYSEDGSAMGTVTESVSVGAVDMSEIFQMQFDSPDQVAGYGYEITAG